MFLALSDMLIVSHIGFLFVQVSVCWSLVLGTVGHFSGVIMLDLAYELGFCILCLFVRTFRSIYLHTHEHLVKVT